MHIVSVSEMKAIEEEANANGFGYDQMMHRAGISMAHIVLKRFSGPGPHQVLGLVGSGNNGGDTLIALSMMQKSGWKSVACLAKERLHDDPLITAFLDAGGRIINYGKTDSQEKLIRSIQQSTVILDGILGTGFKLPLREKAAGLLRLIAEFANNVHIIAVDCPSGTDCDSGECAAETLHADMTICMAAIKKGLLKFPAFGLVGEIIHADIGLLENAFDAVENKTLAIDRNWIKKKLPERAPDAHKGVFGKGLVCGGSVNYPGAPLLAAEAAYRVGTGLVCTAIPSAIYDSLVGNLPESIWLMLPSEMGLLDQAAAEVLNPEIEKYDAVLIGPGLGLDKSTKDFLANLFNSRETGKKRRSIGFLPGELINNQRSNDHKKFVFDADALRIISEFENWHHKIDDEIVITPHPGEMSALTDLSIKEIQENRIEIVKKYAEEWELVIVLKGAGTVISAPKRECVMIPVASPALATAGTGDVLAGMITGLLAQGLDSYDAAVAGAWIHGHAGLYTQRTCGQSASVIASDVVSHIPEVLKNIVAH